MKTDSLQSDAPTEAKGQGLPTLPCSLLLSQGWREYPDRFRNTSRCFYKRHDTPTRCRCNDDKEGMQVCISVSEYEGKTSYELDLAGELPDGTWIKLQNYGMPEDIHEGLAKIPRLLTAWESLANVKESSAV